MERFADVVHRLVLAVGQGAQRGEQVVVGPLDLGVLDDLVPPGGERHSLEQRFDQAGLHSVRLPGRIDT